MRHAGRSLGALLLLGAMGASALATVTFERRWQWSAEDAGNGVSQTADGGYVFCGSILLGDSSHGIVLARTDSLGDTLWVRILPALDAGGGRVCRLESGNHVVIGTKDTLRLYAHCFSDDGDSLWTYVSEERGRASAVIPTGDGGCLIAGRIPEMRYDFGALKLDADGHEEWIRTYDAPSVYETWAYAAVETRDGGFILCGTGHDYEGSYGRLVRTGADGAERWSRLYSDAGDAILRAVTETDERDILALGSEIDSIRGRRNLYVMRFDSAGSVLRTRSYYHPGGSCHGYALRLSAAGSATAAGLVDWIDSARVWLLYLQPDGDTAWTRTLGGPGRESPSDLRNTADGGYVIVGTTETPERGVLAFKTDSLGRVNLGVSAPALRPAAGGPVPSARPNPFTSRTELRRAVPGRRGEPFLVYDAGGRLVRTLPDPAGSSAIAWDGTSQDGRELPPGVYVCVVGADRGAARQTLVKLR